MGWKRALGQIGLHVARTIIPGVGAMETAIQGVKRGPDKKEAVLELVKSSLLTATMVAPDEIDRLLLHPDFLIGLSLQIEGTAKIMNALKAVHREPADFPVAAPGGSSISPAGTPGSTD